MIKDVLNRKIKAWQLLVTYLLFIIAGLIGLNMFAPNNFIYEISVALIFISCAGIFVLLTIFLPSRI